MHAQGQTAPANPPAVRRRLVFYIPGYDPRGAAYYHGLYAREGPKQAAVSGMDIETGPRQRVSELISRWQIRAKEDGASVETQYDFLHWDDIVRETWARSLPAVIAQTVKAWWTILRLGALKKLYSLSWPFAVTASWPIIYLLGAALLAAAAYGAVHFAGRWFAAPLWLSIPLALAAAWFAGRFMLQLAAKANGFWIGRLLAVMLAMGLGALPAADERARQFARHIAERRKQEEHDEILVISHSTGGDIAVRVLARLLEIDPEAGRDGKLSFMSLGQMVVCESMPQGTSAFREDLLNVAIAPGLEWIDFTYPGDPACIALADPLAASVIERPPGAPVRPKLLSPRFLKLFTPQTYAKLRSNKMEMHFMYLQAMEIAGDYDYFAITAGARTLPDRFAHLESVDDFDRLQRGILRGRA
ncbi:MAG: hypothetical protein FJX29_05345 [Alphaproteobacteria bacterium]|nr:hypothetical protein [Alphaproteobacteria bacterium]